jgi:hypothetical protein
MLPGCEPLSDRLRTPEVAADALIGGIYEVIYAHVLRGETARLPGLVPELVQSMLAPFDSAAEDSSADVALGSRQEL